MGSIANKLFNDFELYKLGYDFMGYYFDDRKELSYHHIKTKQQRGKTTYENGALLNRNTSHNYIHTIEEYEFDLFVELSNILKDEHACGSITKQHLQEIRTILEFFEHKYNNQCTKRGNLIIHEDYIRRRVSL